MKGLKIKRLKATGNWNEIENFISENDVHGIAYNRWGDFIVLYKPKKE